MTYRDFATFSPKAIAGLGKLPDTVRSRSIPIRLKRRRNDEEIAEWLPSDPPPEAMELRDKLASWAHANADALKGKRPARPSGLGDRAFDVWRPLLAIADLAEGDWPQTARDAAVALSGRGTAGAASYGVQALAALRALFDGAERLSSAAIVDRLNADEALPFGGWNDGDGMTSRNLARIRDAYSIGPQVLRFSEGTRRGYRVDQFADAWTRYVPVGAPLDVTAKQTASESQMSLDSMRNTDTPVTDMRNAETPDDSGECFAVTDTEVGPGALAATTLPADANGADPSRLFAAPGASVAERVAGMEEANRTRAARPAPEDDDDDWRDR